MTGDKMETRLIWKNGMAFDGIIHDYIVPMDATPPLGNFYGPGPKELVLLGLAGCAGMDVIGLLKKNRQLVNRFEIETRVESSASSHPVIFTSIDLIFKFEGTLDFDITRRAVELSQTLYSGVSAMMSQTVPINWTLVINGEEIGAGRANFLPKAHFLHTSYEG
jgi:putative redox protein